MLSLTTLPTPPPSHSFLSHTRPHPSYTPTPPPSHSLLSHTRQHPSNTRPHPSYTRTHGMTLAGRGVCPWNRKHLLLRQNLWRDLWHLTQEWHVARSTAWMFRALDLPFESFFNYRSMFLTSLFLIVCMCDSMLWKMICCNKIYITTMKANDTNEWCIYIHVILCAHAHAAKGGSIRIVII